MTTRAQRNDENHGDELELLPLRKTSRRNEKDADNEQHYPSTTFNFSPNDDSVDDDDDDDDAVFYEARRMLYISHAFAQFSEIAWQFCLSLFLAACTNYQSLILVSSYGLTVGLCVCMTASKMGRCIDDSLDRLATARRLIWSENLAVVLATGFCYLLLSNSSTLKPTSSPSISDNDNNNNEQSSSSWWQSRFESVPIDTVSVLSLIAIHVLGATAQVFDRAFLVAIERDWVVVLCHSAATVVMRSNKQTAPASDVVFHQWLSETNVGMRQIDLSCKIAAPAVAGFLIPLFVANSQSNDFRWACLFIGAANIVSLVVEYVCTARIYYLIPDLAVKQIRSSNNTTVDPSSHNRNGELNKSECSDHHQQQQQHWCIGLWVPHGLRIFMQQKSAFGGLGLAFLYLNALTFGNGIMTTYLLYRDMKLETVGVLRGVAAGIGLLGTFVYGFSVKRLSLEATGMWSITYQFGCLVLSLVFSLRMNDDDGNNDEHTKNAGDIIALSLLIAGICLSRIGLWVFDIAVTQMQQEEIPGAIRGQVGGVQQSLNSFFGVMSFALGIFFPNPKDFPIYMCVSCLSVGVALILFIIGIYYPRSW